MASIKLNPVFDGISRRIGDIVFVHRKGKIFTRRRGSVNDPKSSAQLEIRRAFSRLVYCWKNMHGLFYDSWYDFGLKKKISGYNAFIGENSVLERSGKPFILFKEFGEKPLLYFSASSGENPGEVICYLKKNEGQEKKHITLFSIKRDRSVSIGHVGRIDAGVEPEQPLIIKGLEKGVEYHLYAVISDNIYLQASTVSESLSVSVMSG